MRQLLLIAAALMAFASQVAAYSNGYIYSRPITVQAGVVPSTQVNFPMLVTGTFSYLATFPNGGMVHNTVALNSQTVPADLIFTSDSAGTTLLNWEIASYSPATGAIEAWIQAPSLSNGTVIYMFYSNLSVSTYQGNATGTWGGNFGAVWHMANGTTQSLVDSSGNGNTLSNTGTTAAAGQIDGGSNNPGGQPDGLITSSTPAGVLNLPNLTYSIWVNLAGLTDTANQGEMALIAQGVDQLYINDSSGNISANIGTTSSTRAAVTTNALTTSAWYYIVMTYASGTHPLIYINGTQAAYSSSGNGSGTDATYSGSIGVGVLGSNNYAYSVNGTIDEARVASVVQSADWILTEYHNQSSPSTFYTIGSATLMAGIAGGGMGIILM